MEKPKDTKRTLLRLAKYLGHQRYLLLLALILTVSANTLSLFGPKISGNAIDAIGTGSTPVDFESVFYYCKLMILFYAGSSCLSLILSRLMIHISQKISYQMRKDLFDKLVELPVGYFDTHPAGDIISRMSYDIDTVNTSLSHDLLQIATSLITVTGSLSMMISLSPKLVLVFAFTVPLSIFVARTLAKRVHPLFSKRSRKLGELNGYIEEIISGQKTIKAYHQEETMIERFDRRNIEAVDAYYDADYYGTMTGPSVMFVNNLSLSLVSMFGSMLFLGNQISLGSLSSFVLYSRKFSGPINEFANIMSDLQSALAAAERVFRLMDEQPELMDKENSLHLKEAQGIVDMEHVKFGYLPGKTIIHDLNLHADKGSLVAIVGPTGAGKTTLINLLMRFYDPESGAVKLDDYDLRDLTRKSVRSQYAMVLQDTWLFEGTIFENIAYGKPDATLDEVIAAAKAARIHSTIMRFPNGYDTHLNENGLNISQGQKQMLTIARAMLLDAKMLILDEATSNVDTRTEIEIQKAMRNLMKDKTCFVIAHRLSTIQNADTILVVQAGEIVEQGNHTELLKKNGLYATLYKSQFQ
ncbi:MAG: ABC transporter ATP-binding protein [Erysipelotrichaceae bacterium]|nr:ABC transporter ATP-binding protein [Erysipelotrichaceae bacterium]